MAIGSDADAVCLRLDRDIARQEPGTAAGLANVTELQLYGESLQSLSDSVFEKTEILRALRLDPVPSETAITASQLTLFDS